MTRKLMIAVVLGVASAPALFAVGCSSANGTEPYSLTGQSQAEVDRRHEQWLRQYRFTDEKGHYYPELAEANRPIR